jgi:hypothetical protein
MIVTFDPGQTDVRRIARAVKLDRDGQETVYRVLLEAKPDLSSPAAVLHTIARSFEDQHEELFRACHEGGVLRGVDFDALVRTWGELFLEDLKPAGEPDAQGHVRIVGVSLGEDVALKEIGPEMDTLTLRRTDRGWVVIAAEWKKFKAAGF